MKKIFQLLLVLCLPVAAHAQYFELTSDGFVNASDPSKKYVVLEFPDNDQKQAYDKVDQYFQSVTERSYDVVRVPNDRISATATDKIEALAGIFKRPYDTQYTLTIRFKDGRIRIDAPSIDQMSAEDGKLRLYPTEPQKGVDAYFIFGKDGKVKNNPGKENLEEFFNDFVNEIIAVFKTSDGQDDDDDDW